MILERFRWPLPALLIFLLTGCGTFSFLSGGGIATPPSAARNDGGVAARNDAGVAARNDGGVAARNDGASVAIPSGPWRADVPVGGFIQPPSGMSVEQAISEITSRSVLLLGSPYRLGGSSPQEGFDCSGLVAHVMQDAFRLRFPRTTEEQAVVGMSVSRDSLRPGDLVFFNTSGRPNSHVGVYLGQSRFVHAPTSRGVVRIESLSQGYWSRRFEQARRLIAQN